ncbi:alpha-1,2-fucosyltransferase [Pedobacter sp. BMA]|uniref:alpha-1,2-fucosyltransferase n=1 Tax=Pedobacter sp. BMA TaxID=1663685 RepID=UPI00064A60D2|nr:alpha-1,2-fucosyltransferase [Pedobacter sp. BMA]KLT66622.1 hypothetical protein AB669_05465 [Pedobacter sp. BMA]
MPKIILKLSGGLGNQMFQYAAARSITTPKNIIIDLSFLNANKHSGNEFTARGYELSVFKSLKTNSFLSGLLTYPAVGHKLIQILSKIKPGKLITLRNAISKKDLNSARLIYMDGYFQDPAYFESIRSILVNDFDLNDLEKTSADTIGDSIASTNSISIHVRRGDYLKPSVNEVHGILPWDYYKGAIEKMNLSMENPVYFIFSDDPEWCVKNIILPDQQIHFVSGNSMYEDLRLMTACKHNIIANSTFSWWGAWLNKNPEKKIIAPKQWFKDEALNSVQKIIPENWIKI